MSHAASSFFQDLSVGRRLTFLMGAGILAIAAAAVVFAVADLRTTAALQGHDAAVRILDLTQETETAVAQLRANQAAFLLRGDRSSAEAYAKQSARLLAVLKTLGDIPATAPIRQAIDTLRDGIAEHATAFGKIATLEGAGPPARLARLKAATEAATAAVETALREPGREALAARMMAIAGHARRLLAGEPQAAVEMVRARNEGFDRALAQAGLGEAETTRLAQLMNAYFAAVIDEAAERGRQQQAAARLDEILGYLRPSLDALVAFRREAEATIGETARKREDARVWMIAGVAATAAAFILLGSLIAVGISRPLRGLAFAGRQLSDGNRDAFLPVSMAGDEIGDLTRALRVLRDAAVNAETRARGQDERARAAVLRSQVLQRIMEDEIASGLAATAEGLAAATADLGRLAEAAGGGAAAIGHHAGDIDAASHQATANLRQLANVASGLHAAIADTQRALVAGEEEDEFAELDIDGSAADEPSVDEQAAALGRLALRARLLALNSVIGAARAGNGHSPSLADVTAEINELGRRIAEHGAVLAARQPVKAPAGPPLDVVVRSVQGHGTATRDILRNAEGAVAAALTLTNAIARINRTAGETGQVAAAMRTAAAEAAERAAKLKSDIDGMLARLRP